MSTQSAPLYDATALAQAIRSRKFSAKDITTWVLETIRQQNPVLNCFTAVLNDSALAQADLIDHRIAGGQDVGPLAGVPFAVKNLFDIAGVTTIAGSKIHAEKAPAKNDATAIARLKNSGAVLVGALNMDEYAYGFTTENTHYGPTHNPHDLNRVAGGSSGGSAAAVAASLLPLTLGTDTNGSIRVPAAFCGIFGLKPTYGRVSRAGALLFAESFDHIGPFARSVRDLALSFDLMHGADPMDPVCSNRPRESTVSALPKGLGDLRVAVADDSYFHQGSDEVFRPVARAAQALGVSRNVTIPDVENARAAAYIITACEGGHLHLPDLRLRPQDFDPVVIERFLAGSLLPASWYQHAQRFRTVFRDRMRELFRTVDVILAPTTPCRAIRIGQPTIRIAGKDLPARPNIGIFTQPFSFIGLPIVSVPVFAHGSLPLGVQVIGPAYKEEWVLRVADELAQMGIAFAHPPVLEKVV
jgi:amidase/aspartyl-tRNA(Asn)/glutamyl-tRNA(Gln) amidotransferase subunit A